MTDLDELMEVLARWKDFKNQQGKGLANFGKYLQDKHPEKGKVPIDFAVEGIENDDFAVLGRLWGRLSRFTHFLTKKAFQDLPLKSFDDFGILMYVSIKKNPKKTDIINYSLLENSTCFEIIKRLVRQNLLTEEADPQDRRSIQVQLSKQGLEVLSKAVIKAYQTAKILAGDLSKQQRSDLLQLLGQLDHFHSFLHEVYPNENMEETLKRLG